MKKYYVSFLLVYYWTISHSYSIEKDFFPTLGKGKSNEGVVIKKENIKKEEKIISNLKYYDKENDSFIYVNIKDKYIKLSCKNYKRNYLIINSPVKKGSYEWAFFATEEYINNKHNDIDKKYNSRFKLILNSEGKFLIQSNYGEVSYLMINSPVKKGSYEWAFFATEEYINNKYNKLDKEYGSEFKLILNSEGKFLIQGNYGELSYLAINGKLKDGSYEWATFATKECIPNKSILIM